MPDLVVLVADRTIEEMLNQVLRRSKAIGIRKVDFKLVRHPEHDPGVWKNPVEYISGYRERCEHALVVLDCAFDGAPDGGRATIESAIRQKLDQAGLGGWAEVVAIEPELENWTWIDSPVVATAIGWEERESPRQWLQRTGAWPANCAKPPQPKEALEAACRKARVPFNSAIHKTIARDASIAKCNDPAFKTVVSYLKGWFPE